MSAASARRRTDGRRSQELGAGGGTAGFFERCRPGASGSRPSRQNDSSLPFIRRSSTEAHMQNCFEIETARICILFLYPALLSAALGFITVFGGWLIGSEIPRFTPRYYWRLLKLRGRREHDWRLAGFSQDEVSKIRLTTTYLTAMFIVLFVPIGIICAKMASFLGSVIFSCSSPI